MKTPLPTTLLAALCLSGCARMAHTTVISRRDPTAGIGTKFFLSSGNIQKDQTLEFKARADVVSQGLTQAGFTPVTNILESDITIFAQFFSGNPQLAIRSYSSPEFHINPGQTFTFNSGGKMGYGFTGNSYSTGTTTEIRSHTEYTRIVILDAYETKSGIGEGPAKQVWSTTLHSVGRNALIEAILPKMISAGTPYFGKVTPKPIKVIN